MSDSSDCEVTADAATITVRVLRLDGRPMSLAMWRQVPDESVVSDDGTLRGEPVGHVNYHARRCRDFGKHLHVLWRCENGQPRQAHVEPPQDLGEPVKFGSRRGSDHRDPGGQLLDALLLAGVLLDDWHPEPGAIHMHDHQLAVWLPINERAFAVVSFDQDSLLRSLRNRADDTDVSHEHLQLKDQVLSHETEDIVRRMAILERLGRVAGEPVNRHELAELIRHDIDGLRRSVERAVAEVRTREANLRETWQVLSELQQLYLTG